MTQLITTQTKQRLLLLASGLLLLAFLSGSLNLSRAAGGRYRPGETPAGLTAGEWAQVRAHIEGAPPAASPLSQGEGVGVRAMVQQAYVKASNTNSGDQFYAVALSGDTLAVGVGSNQGDNSAPAAGAVYVFTRSGGVWSQQAYLKASNTGADDRFGSAVAMAGDTLAVGAPLEKSSAVGVNPPGGQEDNSASWAGAVYVLTRSGGVWSQQAYLKASNTEAYDSFGEEVALAGDTLAVGAYSEESSAVGVNPPGGEGDNSARDAGAAYVLTGFGPPGSTVYLPRVVK